MLEYAMRNLHLQMLQIKVKMILKLAFIMQMKHRTAFTKTPPSYATPRSTAGSSQESVYDLENSDGNLTGNDEFRTNSPFTQVTPKATKGENYSASVAIDLEPSSSREYRNEASKTTLGNETDVSRENDSPSLSGNLSVSSHSTSSRVGESPIQDDGKISSNDDKFRKSSSTSPATYAEFQFAKSSSSTVTSPAYASGSKSPKSSGGKRSDSKRKRNLSKNSPSKKSKPMGQPRRSGRANKESTQEALVTPYDTRTKTKLEYYEKSGN